ncbi:hypothetical protein [Methylorubrum aminovorans]
MVFAYACRLAEADDAAHSLTAPATPRDRAVPITLCVMILLECLILLVSLIWL